MASLDKGFFNALFDFSFSSFVTPKLIKLVYGILIVLAAIFALCTLGSGLVALSRAPGVALLSILVSPLVFFFAVLMGRVYVEMLIVAFRICEHVGEIAQRTRETR